LRREHETVDVFPAFFWSCDCHHFTAFKYLVIACRTTSPRETRFRLAAALSAFICFLSIRAINLVSFMVYLYMMDMYMSSCVRYTDTLTQHGPFRYPFVSCQPGEVLTWDRDPRKDSGVAGESTIEDASQYRG
jgi:hypothetical protein